MFQATRKFINNQTQRRVVDVSHPATHHPIGECIQTARHYEQQGMAFVQGWVVSKWNGVSNIITPHCWNRTDTGDVDYTPIPDNSEYVEGEVMWLQTQYMLRFGCDMPNQSVSLGPCLEYSTGIFTAYMPAIDIEQAREQDFKHCDILHSAPLTDVTPDTILSAWHSLVVLKERYKELA